MAKVMSTQIERFLDHLSVERGLSGNTVSAYRRDLARYASYLAASGVRDARAVDDAAVAGFIALWRFRVSVVWVVLAAGAAGWIRWLVG